MSMSAAAEPLPMSGEPPTEEPTPANPASEADNAVPHSGNGAHTALEAMLRRRQTRAGAEPSSEGSTPRDTGTKK